MLHPLATGTHAHAHARRWACCRQSRDQAATFRAAREAGWTLEAQLDCLDQRVSQQAEEVAAKAARDARRQAEKEATNACKPERRLSVFAKRKVQAPKAATMPAPPTDDVVRGDENGEGRAEARQGSLSLVDALRHKLIRQAAQVAPHHRQTAQGQAGGLRPAR